MKKSGPWLVCFVLLCLCFCLAACGQQPEDSVLSQTQREELSAQLKELYTPALEAAGLTPDEYDFYANFWFDGLFSENEISGLRQIIPLEEGDTAPAFYWDADREILYALTTDQATLQMDILRKNPNADPNTTDFSTLWLKGTQAEAK